MQSYGTVGNIQFPQLFAYYGITHTKRDISNNKEEKGQTEHIHILPSKLYKKPHRRSAWHVPI